MDRLDAMATLLAVLETGSLSAASRRLGTPLATISRRLSDLEAHLGTRLLDRGTRHLTATEAGAAYAESARRILADISEAERTAAGEYRAVKGDLALSASPVLGRMHLTPVVAEFLDQYKDIAVRMQLTDRKANLQEDRIDCGLRIGFLRDSSLIARKVGVIRRVICASPAYLDKRGRPTRLEEIADHDCITFTGLMRAEAWRFPEAGGTTTIDVRSRLVTDSVDTVAEAALAGAGLACALSYHIAPLIRDGRLELLLEDYEPPPVPVSLVHLPGQLQAQKLRAFLDFATPRLKQRLAACAIPRKNAPAEAAGS
jgi:DNA-binding transcriptional LysR family regulator